MINCLVHDSLTDDVAGSKPVDEGIVISGCKVKVMQMFLLDYVQRVFSIQKLKYRGITIPDGMIIMHTNTFQMLD